MGCHSWNYVEYDLNKLEEDRKIAVEYFKNNLLTNNKEYYIENFDWSNKEFSRYKNYINKTIRRLILGNKKSNIIKTIIEHSADNFANAEFYKNKWYRSMSACNGEYPYVYLYQNRIDADNLFRVSDYPDDILDSYEKTISFINRYIKNKPTKIGSYIKSSVVSLEEDASKIDLSEEFEYYYIDGENKDFLKLTEPKIRSYWDIFPNSIITFG